MRPLRDRAATGGLVALLDRQPVLGGDLSYLARAAAGSIRRFWSRVAADRVALEATFGPLGPVVEVSPGLSDPHRGQEMVLRVGFASGTALMYKPRSLAIDEAYHRLIGWLARRGCPYPLRAARVRDRGDHGWAEYIAPDPAGREVERYHERAGALLCVLHVLEATDCHRDNFVVGGATPVLVDCEALLSPRLALPGPDGAAADDDTTVLRTGYLPRWTAADGPLRDICGLNASEPGLRRPRSAAPRSTRWAAGSRTLTAPRSAANHQPQHRPVRGRTPKHRQVLVSRSLEPRRQAGRIAERDVRGQGSHCHARPRLHVSSAAGRHGTLYRNHPRRAQLQ